MTGTVSRKDKTRRCFSCVCGEWNLRRLIQHWSEASQAQTHTQWNHDHKCLYHMHIPITAHSTINILCGPSVWQGLPGRCPADDTLLEFINPRTTDVFQQIYPRRFWSHLRPLRAATTGTSPSWVTCLRYEWEGGQKVKQAHQCQVTVRIWAPIQYKDVLPE